MKHCLIVHYSQSGQVSEIAKAVVSPLSDDFQLHFEELRPKNPYPFPWTGMSFFQAFPESVGEIPCELEPFRFDPGITYDLIILAYPVWYLSPAIPITSFLISEECKKVLAGTPVVTVLGVRNMWIMAQERVKARIQSAGGRLVGNIMLEDPHSNLVSVITIVRWMTTAKKHGSGLYGQLFPPAGVPDERISGSKVYGEAIRDTFRAGDLRPLQDVLVSKGAVEVHPVLFQIEKRAKVMFGFLSRWILKKGGYNSPARVGRLKAFKYYLFTVIYLVSPFASLIFKISFLLRPRKAAEIIRKYTSA